VEAETVTLRVEEAAPFLGTATVEEFRLAVTPLG